MPRPQTPALTVDVVIELVDRPGRPIVLIERRYPPHGCALHGGFVDVGETVEAAACREARPVLTAVPAPSPPRAPLKEKHEGATSQADPTPKEPPAQGGFPEDLEPSVVVPVPVAPSAPGSANGVPTP